MDGPGRRADPDPDRGRDAAHGGAGPMKAMEGPWQAWLDLLRWAKRPFAVFFPPVASDHAEAVDTLYAFLVGMSAFFSLLIAGMILWFSIRYARGRNADRTRPPDSNLVLELFWIAIPLGLSLAIFV